MMVLSHSRSSARGLILLRNFLLPSTRDLSSNVDPKNSSIDDLEDDEQAKVSEIEIEKKRNKSKLMPEDYNKQHEIGPLIVTEKTSLIDKRRAYGLLGKASGVDPALLWPTDEELAFVKEYESVLQPHSIQQLIEMNKKQKKAKEDRLRKMEEEILDKVANIDKRLVEFHKKWAVKRQKAEELLLKKQKMIDEVRKHFGYAVDPRDQKFKAMLFELQEKERKQKKADKKLAKKEAVKPRLDSQAIESDNKSESAQTS